MSEQDDQKLDLASVFPAKGDSRRPPDWWGRGLLYAVIAVFGAIFVWMSWGKVSGVVLDIVISTFLALAIEPLVLSMVKHGWRRGAASAVSLIGLGIIIVALLAMFGNMFVQQLIAMISGLPAMYDQLLKVLQQYTSLDIPHLQNMGMQILEKIQNSSFVTNLAGQALSTTMGVFSFLLDLMTVIMVTYYISAAGPKLRRSMCQWLGPTTQRRFLLGWTIIQEQISGFLFSRSILAAINAVCVAVFLYAINVPYQLPLSIFCGIVSQFVPTVGAYIGGALPMLFAWGVGGWVYAVAVVVYITIYQQIENLILAPKISQRTMDLNPCVAFLSVLVFGSLFGALGAFLALPITASMQAIFRVYTKRYELVDSPLMSDPTPVRKSKVVESAEAFNEHVIKPVSDHMPRAAKGTSARVPMNEELRQLQEQAFRHTSQELDDSATMAIPKGGLLRGAQMPRSAVALRGTAAADGDAVAEGGDDVDYAGFDDVAGDVDDDASGNAAAGANAAAGGKGGKDGSGGTSNADDRSDRDAGFVDNPRSRWR